MRIDVISIFPAYLEPLGLSLPGRATRSGLLDVAVHDLRAWTHDRHRTVDDTPYGGGAGMVMKPEPWGEALDAVAPDGATLVVPSPAGERFTQRTAVELATREHLVFACGRYEGIDARVVESAARRMEVREVSLGDYVLNGGEVASLAIIEAVVRLLPGVLGNAESLAEESHTPESGGLLEYPVYTKPARWRGHAVPEVLLSGDHARIADWRLEQARRRTAQRRPDLLPPHAVGEVVFGPAVPADAGELLTLQRACWLAEQQANPGVRVPALHESLDDVRVWLGSWTVLVGRRAGRLVAAARGRLSGGSGTPVWEVGRVMVAPDLQGQGLGREVLRLIEGAAPDEADAYELFTGATSERNLRMYKRTGYRVVGPLEAERGVVVMRRRRR